MCHVWDRVEDNSDRYANFYIHTTESFKLENLIQYSMLQLFGRLPIEDRRIVDNMRIKLRYSIADFSEEQPGLYINVYEMEANYKEDKVLRFDKVVEVDNDERKVETDYLNEYTDVYHFGSDSYEGIYYFYEFISHMFLYPARYPEFNFKSKQSEQLAALFAKVLPREHDIFMIYDKDVEEYMIDDLRDTLVKNEGDFIQVGRKEALDMFERNALTILKKKMIIGKM